MTRIKKEFPWLSFSDCRTYYTCKRKFKFMVIDGEEGTQSFDWLIRGSEFHLIFNKFYDTVDVEKTVQLASKIKILDDPEKTELFDYFHNLLKSFVQKEMLENDQYAHLFDLNMYGFGLFQVMCIIEIMRANGYINMTMLRKYWLPKGREEFMKDEENKLYGTVDTWYENFDGTFFALDYKTGKKKYQRNVDEDNPKKPRINFPANMQGWFYTWLLHRTKGLPLKGMKFVMLHTKGNPLAVSMKITKASIEGLFNRVNEIRDHVKTNGTFPMADQDSQMFVCPFCQFQKQCHNDEMLEKFARIRKEEWAE